MKFHPMQIAGAVLVESVPHGDDRGYFSRTFCQETFREAGLETNFVQANASFSARQGTLRGIHFQENPHEEAKVVRCTKGAIYDVTVDLRPDSKTYLQWQGVELTDDNHLQIYVPRGLAHGFLTMRDNVAVAYMVSAAYEPASEGGFRWDDPTFAIKWPGEITTISDKDASWPDFRAKPSSSQDD